MAAHARLNNEVMEDEKYHNLMRWLILLINRTQYRWGFKSNFPTNPRLDRSYGYVHVFSTQCEERIIHFNFSSSVHRKKNWHRRHRRIQFAFKRDVQVLRISNEQPHDKTNKIASAPSEDSDQPGHPPSLIRIFAVRMKKALVLSYQLGAQRRL